MIAAAVAGLTLCAPPRGPGDGQVHSRNLIAAHVSCAVARGIALACVRFTYGRSGTCHAAGLGWRCRSDREGLASRQVCVAADRRVSIVWTD